MGKTVSNNKVKSSSIPNIVEAAIDGYRDRVSLFLKFDDTVTVDTASKCGVTPLMAASLNGHYDVVSFLLKKGAKVNAQCRDGMTPLISATLGRHRDIVSLLLKHGADVLLPRHDGVTALMAAADVGDADIMAGLIRVDGSNIDARNKTRKQTALHIAAWRGHVDTVKVLLRNGASINVKDRENCTPSLIASIRNRPNRELVLLLMKQMAYVIAPPTPQDDTTGATLLPRLHDDTAGATAPPTPQDDTTGATLLPRLHDDTTGAKAPRTPQDDTTGATLLPRLHDDTTGAKAPLTPQDDTTGATLLPRLHDDTTGAKAPRTPQDDTTGATLLPRLHDDTTGAKAPLTPQDDTTGATLLPRLHDDTTGAKAPLTPQDGTTGATLLPRLHDDTTGATAPLTPQDDTAGATLLPRLHDDMTGATAPLTLQDDTTGATAFHILKDDWAGSTASNRIQDNTNEDTNLTTSKDELNFTDITLNFIETQPGACSPSVLIPKTVRELESFASSTFSTLGDAQTCPCDECGSHSTTISCPGLNRESEIAALQLTIKEQHIEIDQLQVELGLLRQKLDQANKWYAKQLVNIQKTANSNQSDMEQKNRKLELTIRQQRKEAESLQRRIQMQGVALERSREWCLERMILISQKHDQERKESAKKIQQLSDEAQQFEIDLENRDKEIQRLRAYINALEIGHTYENWDFVTAHRSDESVKTSGYCSHEPARSSTESGCHGSTSGKTSIRYAEPASNQKHFRIFHEKFLLQLSGSVGNIFWQLGTLLGVDYVTIQTLETNYPHDLNRTVYEILGSWVRRSMKTEKEMLTDLIKALQELGRNDIVAKIQHPT